MTCFDFTPITPRVDFLKRIISASPISRGHPVTMRNVTLQNGHSSWIKTTNAHRISEHASDMAGHCQDPEAMKKKAIEQLMHGVTGIWYQHNKYHTKLPVAKQEPETTNAIFVL